MNEKKYAGNRLEIYTDYDKKDYYWVCLDALGWLDGHPSGNGTSVGFSKDFQYVLVHYHFNTKEWNAFSDGVNVCIDELHDFAPFSGYTSLNKKILHGMHSWVWDGLPVTNSTYKNHIYLRFNAAELSELDKDYVTAIGEDCLWRNNEHDEHWTCYLPGSPEKIHADWECETGITGTIQRISQVDDVRIEVDFEADMFGHKIADDCGKACVSDYFWELNMAVNK